MDIEQAFTAGGVILLVIDRITRTVLDRIVQYRRSSGANLRYAFERTGGVIEELSKLHQVLSSNADGGFHSLRLLSAHNSGNDLNKTLNWKSTVLTVFPVASGPGDSWHAHPLDMEYLQKVLRPVVEHGHKYTRIHDLEAHGPLGSMYAKRGITFTVKFLVEKTDAEIIYAAVAFNSVDLTPSQSNEIWQAIAAIEKRINAGRPNSIFNMDTSV
jgi:hypothetical protein